MSAGLGPIGQISRSVKDIKQAEAWYGNVLGLPHLYTFGTLAFFDCGGIRLFLTQSDSPQSESVLYLRVADIERTHAELKSRGVEFVDSPHMIHKHADGIEEWMTFFKDAEGRLLALMAQIKR
ncbi:MAG TPA: VOC family protein [Steroidobacteraceae bacterium]|nr:VOC family protein [Steroidobacteraceae bacterium]